MSIMRRLLIANRGEIACRVIKTAKRMNIKTLAVYSSVDRNAMHVKMADEAHYIGEAEPQKSYLNQDKIIQLARRHQVSAIHPGYGFLSENFEFAQRCQDENIVFVGPKASSIRTMGIKNESKRIMIEAGVPVVPGYHGLDQNDDLLRSEANKIGYPIMIKPVRGGGGKGMRVVRKESDFIEALESARRESLKAFNDQAMLLERYIEKPRHVEVQVFGDSHQNHVYLFERDCSVQRRHQKIIEEAPAPLLSETKRTELGLKAVAAAKAVDYIGAGTVEFILDKSSGDFYFMEMNTRLQVEHPVTELITGTDLVEWQLRVASGETLPKRQSEIHITGHAFEARIYAENPKDNFLPQVGTLDYVSLPDLVSEGQGSRDTSLGRECVRVDTGVTSGDVISPYYDPMISKLIVWTDKDRQTSLDKLNKALDQYLVVGLPTNIGFLKSLASNSSFAAADVGTDFIDIHYTDLFDYQKSHSQPLSADQILQLAPQICAAVHSLVEPQTKRLHDSALAGFRIVKSKRPVLRFQLQMALSEVPVTVSCEYLDKDTIKARISTPLAANKTPCVDNKIDESCVEVTARLSSEGEDTLMVHLDEGQAQHKYTLKSQVLTNMESNKSLLVLQDSDSVSHLIMVSREVAFNAGSASGSSGDSNDPLAALAPMPGVVDKVLVSVGDRVCRDQSLVIMSAMKMEYTVKANSDGLVESLSHKAGDFVSKGTVLVRLEGSPAA